MSTQQHLVSLWLAKAPKDWRAEYDDEVREFARIPVKGDQVQLSHQNLGELLLRVTDVILYPVNIVSKGNAVSRIRLELEAED